MGILARWLGLERRILPAPAEFPAFMEHQFRHRIERAQAEAKEGGGLRVTVKFKNGRELKGKLDNMEDMETFLASCGMIYDL